MNRGTLVGLALLGSTSAMGLAGCKEIPEVAYETEHFEIAPDFDHPICAGTLNHFEEHLSFVESALDHRVPHGERIRFYWITQDLGSWCNERALGCYYPGTRVIVGTARSATHEIVHAVLNADAQTNLFLEEGLAEHFSGVGSPRPSSSSSLTPSDLLWIDAREYRFGELDYAVAQHFVAYIYEEFGTGPIRSIADVVATGAGPPDLEQAIERFTDVDYASLEDFYLDHSHSYYRGLRESDVPHVDTSKWVDASLRCDSTTTFGPLTDVGPGMYRTMRLVMPKAGSIEVQLLAEDDVELTVIEVREERKKGNVLDFFHPVLSGKVEYPTIRGGQQATLQIDGGTHLLLIERDGYEYADAFLRVKVLEFPRG